MQEIPFYEVLIEVIRRLTCEPVEYRVRINKMSLFRLNTVVDGFRHTLHYIM